MKRAALHNLGCKVNAYETEAMQQLLEEYGYEIVPFSEKADVYIVNTCSVTNIADKKSRQMLHRARRLNPAAIVVAAGCYVQTAPRQVRAELSADLLIGNNQKHKLIQLLEEYETRRACGKESSVGAKAPEENHPDRAGRPESSVGPEDSESSVSPEDSEGCGVPWEIRMDLKEKTAYEELSLSRTAEHTRAFIKVQDGCNQFCSYCIIPYARGRVRSRGMAEILAEVGRLARNGYQEVVLTGIHLSSYGTDNGESLLHLIEQVHKIEGIRRIRLGSLEPKIITVEFVKALAALPKLCPHFHLSLQSGCDATLSRMNRKYTCGEYRKGCRLLRDYFEHPAITTDIIVGFPGETEEEFAATRDFVKEISFFEIHIFKYSRRQGTKAAELPDQVPEEIKAERSRILAADAERMSEAFAAWYEGRQVEVLMEEEAELCGQSCYVGHTPEYVKAALPGGKGLANRRIRGIVKKQIPEHILWLQ